MEIDKAGGVGRGGGNVRAGAGPAAQAEDFFSALFGGFVAAAPRASSGCRLPARAARRSAGRGLGATHRLLRRRLRPIACVAATGAISRSTGPTIRAGRPRATVSARRAKPGWSTAAASIMPSPKAASRIRNCRMRFAIATNRRGMHLQRQGPDRSCAGQDRERSDASQGRYCRRRRRLMVAGRSADSAAHRWISRPPRNRCSHAISGYRWWRRSSDVGIRHGRA